MATTKLAQIKTNIKLILEKLVRQKIIADVQVDDLRRALVNREFPKFPVAIVTTPSIENVPLTNVQNIRSYLFEIIVLIKKDSITDSTEVEDLIENILNEFDNDPTLKAGSETGAADGAVEPSTSSPEAIAGTDYIGFSILLRVRAVRDLTYQ